VFIEDLELLDDSLYTGENMEIALKQFAF